MSLLSYFIDSVIFNVTYFSDNDPTAVFHDLAALAPALDLQNWPAHHPTFLLANAEKRAQLLHLQKENAGALGKMIMKIGFIFIFFFRKMMLIMIGNENHPSCISFLPIPSLLFPHMHHTGFFKDEVLPLGILKEVICLRPKVLAP